MPGAGGASRPPQLQELGGGEDLVAPEVAQERDVARLQRAGHGAGGAVVVDRGAVVAVRVDVARGLGPVAQSSSRRSAFRGHRTQLGAVPAAVSAARARWSAFPRWRAGSPWARSPVAEVARVLGDAGSARSGSPRLRGGGRRARAGRRRGGGQLLAVQFFHRQRGGEEPGARDAIGDPEVDGAVDGELDDVVG